MTRHRALRDALAAEGRAALVAVERVEGSAPREAGAFMIVRPSGEFSGTIGGGALEWAAIKGAVAALQKHERLPVLQQHSLGPDLGQCCGGRVTLRVEFFAEADRDRVDARARAEDEEGTPVFLFGAGHVGRALVLALAPLPFAVRWIDSRPDAFPERGPINARFVAAGDPAGELRSAPPGTIVLVMTHSHPLDLDIVARALRTPAVVHCGLIGSATKRARFVNRLKEIGYQPREIERLACPIGVLGIRGKEPPVIAASVAAELLLIRSRLASMQQQPSAA